MTKPEIENASYYGKRDGFHNHTTALGSRMGRTAREELEDALQTKVSQESAEKIVRTLTVFNRDALTAASLKHPLGTVLYAKNPDTDQHAVLVVTDKGPYVDGRDIDISVKANEVLGLRQNNAGIDKLLVHPVGRAFSLYEGQDGKPHVKMNDERLLTWWWEHQKSVLGKDRSAGDPALFVGDPAPERRFAVEEVREIPQAPEGSIPGKAKRPTELA
jgi:hypothetical protein